jgi:PKD repeat protein
MKHLFFLPVGLLALTACHNSTPEPTPPARTQATADFVLPTNAEATLALSFQNISQNATSYKWSFGDGGTDQTAAPTHTYTRSGTYSVTLRAYNGPQDSASVTKSLLVSDYKVFQHTAPTVIPGTYDCRVYVYKSYYPPYSSSSTYTRLPNAVLAVSATGTQTLTIDGVAGAYAPGAATVVAPGGPNYPFLMNIAERSLAHFYTSGDSLLYTQWSHTGHSYTTTVYYRGIRRP